MAFSRAIPSDERVTERERDQETERVTDTVDVDVDVNGINLVWRSAHRSHGEVL